MPGQASKASTYRERNSTADRALEILMLFSDTRLTLSAVEVSTHLDVARSTGYRYLQSLTTWGFLEESDEGGYRLGPRVFDLARLARKGLAVSDVARPVMRRLAEQTGEAVLLTRLAGDAVICIEREGGTSGAVRISYERGQVLPTNAGASATVLLAWLPAAEIDRILSSVTLQRFTPATLTSARAIKTRLAETRKQGYALSHGELDFHVLGVAAPVRGPEGDVVCALSVAAVAARVTGADATRIATAVRAAADEITETLGLRA